MNNYLLHASKSNKMVSEQSIEFIISLLIISTMDLKKAMQSSLIVKIDIMYVLQLDIIYKRLFKTNLQVVDLGLLKSTPINAASKSHSPKR